MKKYRAIIVMGPSGIGKTYLTKVLIDKYPKSFAHAPVYVTREKRPNEDRIAIGRKFITFSDMQSNEFLFKEYFANNWYGYKEDSLVPVDQHLVVDVSPQLIESAFTYTDDPLTIGLLPSKVLLKKLNYRLIERGDSKQVIAERQEFISRDVRNLEKIQSDKRIKVFTIEDDSSIPNDVIPWIEQQLNL